MSRLVRPLLLVVLLAGGAAARPGEPAPAPQKAPATDDPLARYRRPAGMSDDVRQQVEVVDRQGEQLPLDAAFDDERGKRVTLGEVAGGKPFLLQFVYFRCPGLCNAVLNGTLDMLHELDMRPGDEFELITVSISASETSSLASAKKESYLRQLGRPEDAPGWHFLTGSEAQIEKLTAAAGFGFRFDEETREYAHGAALFVVTPKGVLSRTLPDASYEARSVRLALIEAADGKIGTTFDQMLLFCYHFDPTTGRYTGTVMGATRVVGVLFASWLIGLVGIYLWRERRRGAATEPAALDAAQSSEPGREDTASEHEPAGAGGTR
ncbi:MAG: SCO family protein [Planctomycetota bacterium]